MAKELLASMKTEGDEMTKPGQVVLYYAADNIPCEYVTWWQDDDGNNYLGHYFHTRLAAQADFLDRCRRTLHLMGNIVEPDDPAPPMEPIKAKIEGLPDEDSRA